MIGVIGGNGVAATNKLCELVEEMYIKNGAFRDAHHPEMLIWQATQAPSRSMYFEGRGDSFVDDYVRIGSMMKKCGVDTLCMCCNTAHIVVKELEAKIKVPFINLIHEVAETIAETPGIRKVGIMCSDGLRKFGTYDQYIKSAAPSVEVVYPDEDNQALVTKGICNAKNINKYTEHSDMENPYTIFSKVIEHLKSCGCDCVIAGCTDIRSVFKYENSDISYIDSLEVLANSVFEKSKL
jgi:aspartate racemase